MLEHFRHGGGGLDPLVWRAVELLQKVPSKT